MAFFAIFLLLIGAYLFRRGTRIMDLFTALCGVGIIVIVIGAVNFAVLYEQH